MLKALKRFRNRKPDVLDFYQDDAGEWRWRIVAPNNKITAASSEGFASPRNARRNFKLVRKTMLSSMKVIKTPRAKKAA